LLDKDWKSPYTVTEDPAISLAWPALARGWERLGKLSICERMGKMRILACIMGIILASAGLAAAVDQPTQLEVLALAGSTGYAPYKGIIRNCTRYEVSIPSKNSLGTVTIPPFGWIEYITWAQKADVTAYRDGQPFYCLKIQAKPQQFPFMCKKYDFMEEIVKVEEPRATPTKLKRRIKRKAKRPPC
jgi:hypothetical protein